MVFSNATLYGLSEEVSIPEIAPFQPIILYGKRNSAVQYLLADLAQEPQLLTLILGSGRRLPYNVVPRTDGDAAMPIADQLRLQEAGLIQSVSQEPLPKLRALDWIGGIASLQCSKPCLLQLIST